MYAVIESGGKQYRVVPGDVIRVETLTAKVGDVGDFGRVLAISQDDGKLIVGKAAAGAKVEAKIIGNGRAKKILVFHFKRKKQYKKTQGHRQNFTEVKVERIIV